MVEEPVKSKGTGSSNYDIDDEKLGTLIDDLCKMSKKINITKE